MSIDSEHELTAMKAAGAVVSRALKEMKAAVRPGVTTRELDEICGEVMRAEGARSAPVMVYDFPGNACISVNDEVVHGVPGDRKLQDGDIVKLDVTLEKDGFMADAAVSVPVGDVSSAGRRLIRCAEEAFWEAMKAARPGMKLRDIGGAVESVVRRDGFSVVRELSGHGIGRTIHEEPSVPNYDEPRATKALNKGLVITVEPIITAGRGDVFTAGDRWTVKTHDRKLAAHYEHTIVITDGEPLILTAAV
jgi:methionyl aminopeptidase